MTAKKLSQDVLIAAFAAALADALFDMIEDAVDDMDMPTPAEGTIITLEGDDDTPPEPESLFDADPNSLADALLKGVTDTLVARRKEAAEWDKLRDMFPRQQFVL